MVGVHALSGHAPPLHPRFFSPRASAYSARKIHGGRWMRRGSAGTFCTGRGQSGGLLLAPVSLDLQCCSPTGLLYVRIPISEKGVLS